MSANESKQVVPDPLAVVRNQAGAPLSGIAQQARPTVVEPLLTTHPLALISAPAEWGKTSLIAAWSAAELDESHLQGVLDHLRSLAIGIRRFEVDPTPGPSRTKEGVR